MKQKILKNNLVVFILIGWGLNLHSQNTDSILLKNYLTQIESQFEVSFSFLEETIADIKVPNKKMETLEQAMAHIRDNSRLRVSKMEANKYAIVKRTTLDLCGYVLDNFGKNTIPGASIELLGKPIATVTDIEGKFILNDIPLNSTLKIRYLGFQTQYIPASNLVGVSCARILLAEQREKLQEVVVYKLLTKGISQESNGSILVNPQELGVLPGLSEPDILLGIQALPGIKSIDETVSNLNIRGGTNDQNLVLWNDIKLYQSGHFFGLISAINPYLINTVEIYKNGTPCNYGDGVSSLINLSTGDQNPELFKAGVGLNLISADAFVIAPLTNKLGLQLSARRSTTDFLNTPAYNSFTDRAFQDTQVRNFASGGENVEEAETNENFNFFDLSAKLFYDLNQQHRFRLNYFYLNNQLDFLRNSPINNNLEIGNLEQQNLSLGFQALNQWRANFSTRFIAYFTQYDLNAISLVSRQQQQVNQGNQVQESSVKLNAKWMVNEDWVWSAGYQFVETGITNSTEVNLPSFRSRIKGVVRVHSAYSQTKYSSFGDQFIGILGLRANYLQNLETFNKITLEPRLNLNFKVANYLRAQILAEQKSQAVNQVIDLEDNFLGLEKRRWVLSGDQDLPVTQSSQISAGLNFEKNGIYLGIDTFYKRVEGISTKTQDFQNENQFLNDAVGRFEVLGLEFLGNYKKGDFSSWLSYDLNLNDYFFEELNPSEFPNNLDIRHNLSLASAIDVNSFKIALGINYRTGRPFTQPDEGNPTDDRVFPAQINYSSTNSSRLPYYLRLDATLSYAYLVNRKSKMSVSLSVLNLTGRKNILNRYYRINQDNEIEEVSNTSLGFTPNISLRFSF